MGKERRYFSDEFKTDAVRRLAAGEQSLSQIARDLAIHPSLLQTWRRKIGSTVIRMNVKTNPPLSLEDEVRRLRRENASLREDRELEKAVVSSTDQRNSSFNLAAGV